MAHIFSFWARPDLGFAKRLRREVESADDVKLAHKPFQPRFLGFIIMLQEIVELKALSKQCASIQARFSQSEVDRCSITSIDKTVFGAFDLDGSGTWETLGTH